jgi:hypothetical protein
MTWMPVSANVVSFALPVNLGQSAKQGKLGLAGFFTAFV